jgi:hypothetical protein
MEADLDTPAHGSGIEDDMGKIVDLGPQLRSTGSHEIIVEPMLDVDDPHENRSYASELVVKYTGL